MADDPQIPLIGPQGGDGESAEDAAEKTAAAHIGKAKEAQERDHTLTAETQLGKAKDQAKLQKQMRERSNNKSGNGQGNGGKKRRNHALPRAEVLGDYQPAKQLSTKTGICRSR